MKIPVKELVLPQTLVECHGLIQQLIADLGASQTRVAELEAQNQALTEKVRDLAHRVFGQKSERQTAHGAVENPDATPESESPDRPSTRSASATPVLEATPTAAVASANPPPAPVSPRRRGQQPGTPGHGRQRRPELPERIVYQDVPEAQQRCPACGDWYAAAGVEEAEQIDWQVHVERVVIRRRRYRQTCTCVTGTPRTVTAPPAPSLIPKGLLTVPAVVTLVLMKFLWGLPIHRLVGMLASQGCAISAGTLVGVLKRLSPLLAPLDQAIRARNRDEPQLHADESRWKVFSETAGKAGHNWWLWVFSGLMTTVFVLDPSRSGQVPRTHLHLKDETRSTPRRRTLITDNYVVYRILGGGIRNAWCWAHIRRKFIEAARSVPALEAWSARWVVRIAELYRRYHRRAKASTDSAEWREADHALRDWVAALECAWRDELADPPVAPRAAQVLRTVQRQWEGLTVFLDDPRVPLDNNTAERWLRTPVVGRKNYYGSRAQWSGELAAMCWTVWATAVQNNLNPQAYLTAYLTACAEHGGQPLDEQALRRFLPWALAGADRAAWAAPGTVAS